MWALLRRCGTQQVVPAPTLLKPWLTRARQSPVTPPTTAAPWTASSAVTSITWLQLHTTRPVTVWSLRPIISWQVSYLLGKGLCLQVYTTSHINMCVFPSLRTLPTLQRSGQYIVWTAHCHSLLGKEQPRCGLRRLPWQPKWLIHILRYHRHPVYFLRTGMWHRVQRVGQGPGRTDQQLWQHSGVCYIRWIHVWSNF